MSLPSHNGTPVSLKVETSVETPKISKDDTSNVDHEPQEFELSLSGSFQIPDACKLNVKTVNSVEPLSSSSTIDGSPCNINTSSRNTRRYSTRRSVVLANQEMVIKRVVNEDVVSSNSKSKSRRCSKRKCIVRSKQFQEQEDSITKEGSQEDAILTISNVRASKTPPKYKVKQTSFRHYAKSNGMDLGSLKSKEAVGLKRKVRSKTNLRSQKKEGTCDEDMASWLQGTQFENFCVAESDFDNEAVARKSVQGILQIFEIVCTKLEASSMCHAPGFRIDLATLHFIKNRFKCLGSRRKYLGPIPGIEVGDVYRCRVEISIIGLHRSLQAGIGCINHGEKVVAASIVSCGGYNNSIDSSGILIYSGAGGHPGHRTKNENRCADQKLEGGNLALKNSIEACTPVRVIYGLTEDEHGYNHLLKSKKIAAYIYDGLYLVEKYWSEPESNGFSALKFQLRRIPGQRDTGIKVIERSKTFEVRRGVCIEDISCGKEELPIICVNTIDHEVPLPFTYVTRMIYPPHHDLAPLEGCDCKEGCSDSVKCACVIRNGGEVPFNREKAILVAKPLVYECGPACNCPPSCQNRVSQHGIKFRLEVFKTKLMGWGVRSPNRIPSGSFICEYIGEMLEDAEADKRENDDYLFDIGNNYFDESLWEGLSYVPSLQKRTGGEMKVEYTIDAAKLANVGRFINHSCTPNLYAQNILYDHDDQGMPHVMLFASEDIPPFVELTYHYNYYIDRVQGSDGNLKTKDCYCGSFECSGRLY